MTRNLLPIGTRIRFTGEGEKGIEGTITEYLPGKKEDEIGAYMVVTSEGINRPTLPDDEFEVLDI